MILMVMALLAGAPATSAYETCLNTGEAGNGIQSAMHRCADQEFRRQDARLNRVYKAKMASLPPQRQAALRDLQRRWIVDRDRRCPVKTGYSMGPMETLDCRSGLTEKRSAWLERFR